MTGQRSVAAKRAGFVAARGGRGGGGLRARGMTGERAAAAKLAGFVAALLVVLAVGCGVGAATGPGGEPEPGQRTTTTMPPGMDMEHGS